MKRREFIERSALTGIGLSFLPSLPEAFGLPTIRQSEEFRRLCYDLLKDWVEGMMKIQVNAPGDPHVHGMLKCPACDEVHARMMDAVYPFLYMAKATGDSKYLNAGITLFDWGENVNRPDGSWTNALSPYSWNGTTVFGAISLAEALHYHGDLLDESRRKQWTDRLAAAMEFNYEKFDAIDSTNVNYGITNIYALNLTGRVLKKEEYLERSRKLAGDVKAYFTQPNTLLFGEIKPSAHKVSVKGLMGVDLGYNVEESLNSLVMYALHEGDEELIDLLTSTLNSHLEFMLPDGGWDNGWGTRMYKWTYWGSRTCDGCQPAFGMMANYNPAFGTAAFKNTELLQRCTSDGLLHGGPHYLSHGIKPCVHHTFAHAKPLAAMLDHWDTLPEINMDTPLPRETADGLRYFKELDVALFARGDWRGTVSAYDAEYHYKLDFRQATGGAMSLLYHNKVGPLFAASMAKYKLVEIANQQPAPGEDIALTPRVESYKYGEWFTNLFDLTATFNTSDRAGKISIDAKMQLKNEVRQVLEGSASDFALSYVCTAEGMVLSASTDQEIMEDTMFVLPIISASTEEMIQVSDREISIKKEKGMVRIKSDGLLKVKNMPKSRTFNMVPGMEAIPLMAMIDKEKKQVKITIEVV
ncbi:hypothetical protein GCM10007049_17410 [Echinicola pacifica]|uniref:Uncharacterized protein n=1 Tax=Echinicola pacifica TaxID=346377 RepID=A0A918PWJ4_9BACT|nr:hypothetical protein [Echinicola pacifica]GGZ25414.1 hypothetical protein GCM10007049_17410 [Echinicola pacifica]